MPLWTPTKKTHSYRAEIRVKGPKKASEMKSFRKALKKLVRKAKGKVRERKPK
ncbi:MAG TPA: hypothetical protein VGM22_28445 [Methylomirabilota bacterium]|jgi:hypothetical protein